MRTFVLKALLVCGVATYYLPLKADDLTGIVAKAASNYKARESLAANFTFSESFKNLNFNAKGKTTLDISDTFEVIVLEGAPYYHHTEHNGKPLWGWDAHKEDQKMEEAAKARRSGDRKAGLFPHGLNIQLPIAELSENYSLSSSGEVAVNGRPAYVIEASPADSLLSAKNLSPFAKVVRMTLWIDKQDNELTKVRAEVIRDGTRYGQGAVVEVDYEKVRDEVWLRKRFHFKGNVADGNHLVGAEAEQRSYNYKRFSSESKVVAE